MTEGWLVTVVYRLNNQLLRFAILGILIALFLVQVAGCRQTIRPTEEATKLLNELNGWDNSELRAYMNPERPLPRVVSGESTYFIEEHIDAINSIGFDVEWSDKDSQFLLVKGGEGDPKLNIRSSDHRSNDGDH